MDDFSSLEKICPYCDETGTVINPRFIERQLNGSIDKNLEDIIIKCPICNGNRIIPTELGMGILELVNIYNQEGE